MTRLTALSVCKLTFFFVLFFIQRHLGFGSLIKKAYSALNYPQFSKMPPKPRLKIILFSSDWEFQQHLSLKINGLFVVECFPHATPFVINICTSVCLIIRSPAWNQKSNFFRSLCELIKEYLLIWGHSSFHSFAFWAAVQCQSLIINNQFHQVTAEIQPIADTQRVNLALTPGWKWPFKTNLGIYKMTDRLSLCAELPAPCCCWLGVFFLIA